MSQGGLPAVVFDTMILDQATASLTGPASELLRRLEAGQFILYVSDEILDEAHDVLSRPKLRAKNPRVTDETSATDYLESSGPASSLDATTPATAVRTLRDFEQARARMGHRPSSARTMTGSL